MSIERAESPGSVADRKPLTRVLGGLDFVDEGDGIVLEGNTATPTVHEEIVLTEPELPGALTGLKQVGVQFSLIMLLRKSKLKMWSQWTCCRWVRRWHRCVD